jgi:hypothetical protein
MGLGLTQAQHRPSSQLSKGKPTSKIVGKMQLFSFLATSVATFGLFAPTQAAFGYSGAQQTNLAETQHLDCVKKDAQHLLCKVEPQNQKAVQVTQSDKSAQLLPHLSSAQSSRLANFFIWLSFLIPSGVCLGFFLHHEYSAYRTTVLNRQIELLERLWQYDSDNDARTDNGRGARG